MSVRRSPGEVVIRTPGSGFIAAGEPAVIRVPSGDTYQSEAAPCMVSYRNMSSTDTIGCGDPECREWANLEIMEGPHTGSFLFHISECEMETLEDFKSI